MAEGAEGNLGSRVCKLPKREIGEPRAGCQGWYGSPNNCSGFQKWQKQSCLKFIWMLLKIQEFVPWNPPRWTLRKPRLPDLSLICHRGACNSSRRPSRQRERDRDGIGADVAPLPRTRSDSARGRAADLRAKCGSSSWLYHTRVEARLVYIQSAISSSFEALREQSCYARIKNKCSRNGPAGNEQREAFVAWPTWPCGEKQSIRPIFQHVLQDNNNPHSGVDPLQWKQGSPIFCAHVDWGSAVEHDEI